MTYKSEIGKLGEDLATNYLLSKGYKIIERNYRKPWGELDIVAKDPANTLVFVEVKTLRQAQCEQCGNSAIHGERFRIIAGLNPEDNLTSAKLRKLQRTAQMFAGQFPDLVDENRGWRIDLLSVCLTEAVNRITHYQNI